MTKEGMVHTMTEAEIDAAILKGAEVAGEEARKGLGLPVESVADQAVAPAILESAPSVTPVAVDAAVPKMAVVDAAPKVKKAEPGKKPHHSKGKKSTVVTSATGAGRHKGGRIGNKAAKGLSEKIAAQTGADKVVVEKKKAKEVPVIAEFPEWGVSHDSVYESRTVVAATPERTVTTSAVLGQQEMTPIFAKTDKEEVIGVDPAVLAARAAEEARARLEQIQEEEGSVEPTHAEAAPLAETLPPLEEFAPATEVTPDKGKLGKLREELAELRVKYASRMYEHDRLTEQLRRSPIGRFLKKGIGEADADMPDLEYWRVEYEEKLTALREAELGEIKESGIKGQELGEAMAGLLRASKIEEPLELIKKRDEYRLEGKELSDKAYNAFRFISEKYNKLPTKYKVMAGVGIGLLALGSASLGGAALGGVAMFARRFVSGAGFAVAIDAKLDEGTEKRFRKQAEEEITAELDQLFGSVGASPEGESLPERSQKEMMQMFEACLQAASGGVTVAFEDQLFKRKLNGVAGVALGTMAGFVGSTAAEWFVESGAMDATHDVIFGQDAVPVEMTETELAERTAAAREMAEEYGGASPERQLDIRSATSMTDGQLSALARTMEIEGGHIIPEPTDAADVSLSGQQLSQAEIDARETANMREVAQYENIQEIREKEVAEIIPGDLAKESGNMHSRMDFIEISPEAGAKIPTIDVDIQPEVGFTPELRPRVNDWFSQIFRVDGEMPGSGRDWVLDREKLANTKISDMIRDAVLYQRGEVSGFRTNLSVEQLKNFAQFFQNAGTGVGDQKAMAGIIYDTMRNKDMTVMDYLEKVAPIAKQGQRFGLFTTSV